MKLEPDSTELNNAGLTSVGLWVAEASRAAANSARGRGRPAAAIDNAEGLDA